MQRAPFSSQNDSELMTFAEIGKRLGIPRSTAIYHYNNAMRKLREALLERPDICQAKLGGNTAD